MNNEKLLRLLKAVADSTDKGKVKWEATPSENVFRTWIGDGVIQLSCRSFRDQNDQPEKTYSVRVLDASDEIVEEWDSSDYFMEKLYASARRQAKNADDVMERMLDRLKS
jgi:hypothetical protein